MPLRILHVCYSFPPDAAGGTEVYVELLSRRLAGHGVVSTVAAPAPAEQTYEHDRLRVRRFAQGGGSTLGRFYAGDPVAAQSFGRLLDDEGPDVVHQHALSPACSPLLAVEAKRRGIPIVFTYHTPTVSCQRGTLLEGGRTPCDGRLAVTRCTACTLQGLGTGRLLGRLLAAVPADAGDLVGRLGREGGVWTAVRMSSLLRRRHAALRAFFDTVDRVVVLTPWVEALLLLNGVSASKIVRSPHGIDSVRSSPTSGGRQDRRPVRMAHLGRVDRSKGTDLLIRALRLTLHAQVELDIYGVVQDSHSAALLDELQALAGRDARIRFLRPLPGEDVVSTLAHYDVVAVPSQLMETGPLVVLEAFAAGVPVVGSDLGGIADKVRDGVDGLLVRPFDSVLAWTAALTRVAADAELMTTLARGVRAPRTMDPVAAAMGECYRSLVPVVPRGRSMAAEPASCVAGAESLRR